MKVYVVRELKTREYLTETRDFINDLRQAELFFDYDCAKSFSPYGCEVVEIQLMETKDLADYTKQVRKEVVGDLKEELKKNGKCSIRVNGTMDFFIELDKLNAILDQIQGE